jgi:hypothetical protein
MQMAASNQEFQHLPVLNAPYNSMQLLEWNNTNNNYRTTTFANSLETIIQISSYVKLASDCKNVCFKVLYCRETYYNSSSDCSGGL